MDRDCLVLFFFFQAEDGIRAHCVTGVQTCTLPICALRCRAGRHQRGVQHDLPRDRDPGGDRKSVVSGKSVDLGGRRILKKKMPMIAGCSGEITAINKAGAGRATSAPPGKGFDAGLYLIYYGGGYKIFFFFKQKTAYEITV